MSKFLEVVKTKYLASQEAYNRAGAALGLALISGGAMASTPPPSTLDASIDAMITQMTAGVGTVFSKIVPLLVLVFGMAFAIKWVRTTVKR